MGKELEKLRGAMDSFFTGLHEKLNTLTKKVQEVNSGAEYAKRAGDSEKLNGKTLNDVVDMAATTLNESVDDLRDNLLSTLAGQINLNDDDMGYAIRRQMSQANGTLMPQWLIGTVTDNTVTLTVGASGEYSVLQDGVEVTTFIGDSVTITELEPLGSYRFEVVPIIDGELVDTAMSNAVSIVAGEVAMQVVTVMFFGQSEVDTVFKRGGFWDLDPRPDTTGTNMVVVDQSGGLATPNKVEVSNEAIDAGTVSPTMGVLAVYLRDTIGPHIRFVIGDGAVPGTGRGSLADDTTDEDAGSDGLKRYWADFISVKDLIEVEYGPIQLLLENWYNADASCIDRFKECFWPFYFGVDQYGTRVEIGDAVPTSATASYQLDHILYDATVGPDELGRGIFKKSETAWAIMTPMPFNNAPTGTEQSNFDDRDLRLNAPARQVMHSLLDDPIAQSVRVSISQSAHWCDFDGGIHPKEDTDPNGKAAYVSSFVSAILTAAGHQTYEPFITSVTCPDTGAYADVHIDMLNGGKLTTWEDQDTSRGIYSKEFVMSLRWDQSTRGARIPVSEMKKLGVDTLPDGVVWTGDRLTIAEGAVVDELVGWDLSDIWFIVGGNINRISDCLITESIGKYYIIDVASTGYIDVLEWCNIIGKGDVSDRLEAAVVGRLSGDLTTGGTIGTTRRCGFFNVPKDVIKSRWPGQIVECYFDSPVNMPHAPVEWQAEVMYPSGQLVYQVDGSNTYVHESVNSGNIGIQPPMSKTTSTDDWLAKDPHVDTINPHGCYDGGVLKIRGCYINLSDNREYQPDNGAVGLGMNNGIRYSDDAGLGGLGSVDAQYCILEYNDGEISYPIALQSNTGSILDNMWINASASGQYIYPGTETGNTIGTITEFDRIRSNLTPHRMGVVGFEWARAAAAARKPVMQPSEDLYDDVFKGLVYIVDDGAVSGTGIVRFIPNVPFKFGDSFKYLDGQATAITQIDRDVESRLYKNFLAEQTHEFVDQDFPYRGIPVRPQQLTMAIPMPPPVFVPRAATFDGASALTATPIIESTGNGLISFFARNTQSAWTQLKYILQARAHGGSTKFEIRTDGNWGDDFKGVMRYNVNYTTSEGSETASSSSFFKEVGNVPFNIGEWFHVLIGFTEGSVKVVVNRNLVKSDTTIGTPYVGELTAVGLGSLIYPSGMFTGDIGHFWASFSHYEDPELSETLDKFVIDGIPVDLGPNGEAVMGEIPDLYFDGDGQEWNNRGVSGAFNTTGTLTASRNPPGGNKVLLDNVGIYHIEGDIIDVAITEVTAQLYDKDNIAINDPISCIIANSTWSVALEVPVGADYTVEITTNLGDVLVSDSFSVGVVIAGVGQSEQNIQHGDSISQNVEYVGSSNVNLLTYENNTAKLVDITSGGYDNLICKANQLISDIPEVDPVPILLVNMSVPGSSVLHWLSDFNGGSNLYWDANAVSLLDKVQGINASDILFGTTDASMNQTDWFNSVEALYRQIESHFTWVDDTIPVSVVPLARKMPPRTGMREIQILQGESGGRYYPGSVVNDIRLDYSPYPTNTTPPHQAADHIDGSNRLAKYVGRSIVPTLNYPITDVRGARITSIVYTDSTETKAKVNILNNGDTQLVRTPDGSVTGILGFEINVNDTGWVNSGFTVSIESGICYITKDSGDWLGSLVQVRYMHDDTMAAGGVFGTLPADPYGEPEATAAEDLNMAAFDKTLHDTTNFNDNRGMAIYRLVEGLTIGAA